MAARALRREAEIAADDSVIVAGVKPSAYAGELLRLAEEFREGRPALATLSLYMAERSALGARVESVLEPTSVRSGVTLMDVTRMACCALVSAAAIAFACPSLAQEPPPPPTPVVAPPSPPAPPAAPPAPPAIAVPDAPPAPPAPPSPAIHVVAPHLSTHVLLEQYRFHKLRAADWKRIRADVARARREAHEAVERARPEIERARREAREAVERARPEIERAIAQVKAGELQMKTQEEAMRAVREAQPRIDAAMKSIGPEIERAFAKAREDLRKAHIDPAMESTIENAMRDAQVKMETRGDDAGESAGDEPTNPTAPEN
jgi:hypothetical protein